MTPARGVRCQVCGIDFSGAADAGRKTWIASGVPDGDALRIEACRPAALLPGSGPDRDRALASLRAFIAQGSGCAFGLDFPFGLPRALVPDTSWEDFVLAFAGRYPDPEAFRSACRAAAGRSLASERGRELRRVTDAERRTPFAAYNLRLFRQTFFGLRDLLAPLVRAGAACVLPMQPARAGVPWVLEVCPAVTLRQAGLYSPYKGRGAAHLAARTRILATLEGQGLLHVADARLRSAILADQGGDALDGVLAALTAWRAVRDPAGLIPEDGDAYLTEGHIYV